jgi:hypothetical protein
MQNKMIIPWVLIFCSSCDPGYIVKINNQSKMDINIEVRGDSSINLNYMDSIRILDDLSPSEINIIAVSKNIAGNSYSFDLGKGKSAVLQQGIGIPKLQEKIIVDHKDTIALNNDKRVVREKDGISTEININYKTK